MGYSGGIPKSTERSSGAAKPTARPHGPPSTKPQSRMGKCMGQSILPTCGTWPVTMGRTKARARKSAASTMLRAGEVCFVFIGVPPCRPHRDRKRGSALGNASQRQTPSWRLLQKVRRKISVRRASARRPGFLPEIVKIIAECRRICQDRCKADCKLTKKGCVWSGF